MFFIHKKKLNVAIQNAIREKFGERLNKLRKGDEVVLEDLFHSAPKFISGVPSSQDAFKVQFKVLAKKFKQRVSFNNIENYLRLYNKISVKKLSSLSQITEDQIKTIIDEMSKNSKQKCLLAAVEGKRTNFHEGELKDMNALKFTIENGVITIKSEEEEDIIALLNEKIAFIDNLMKKI